MKLVREHINEKFTEESDPVKDMNIGFKGAKLWAHEMVATLQVHKVTQFGGSIPVQNIDIVNLFDDAADITAEVKVGNIMFNLYFNIRDRRRWKDTEPKWESEITIGSPQKKGYFTIKATGKNTSPEKLLEKLSMMFDLRYQQRQKSVLNK